MDKFFLRPGELYISEAPCEITTILGSCVAVCIYDRKLKIGGMNHVVLPNKDSSSRNSTLDTLQFADTSTIELLKGMKELGCHPKDLVVKVLGGASSFTEGAHGKNIVNVGQKNIQVVHSILRRFQLNVESDACGGKNGKKVLFNTQTGDLFYKNLGEVAGEAKKKLSVIIVDDSKPIRILLKKIIEKNPNFEVVAEASHPYEAMSFLEKNRADVMTLDINMPKMDGVTYLKQFMKEDPIPTIMITDYSFNTCGPVFEALENGAVDYIQKPAMNDFEQQGIAIRSKIQMACQVNLENVGQTLRKKKIQPLYHFDDFHFSNEIILIGASTGGTIALTELLASFPDFIPPVLIVQHIPKEFSNAFACRLDEQFKFNVKEAVHGEDVKIGTVYIAPGDQHMKIGCEGVQKKIILSDAEPVNKFKPSIDVLFKSACQLEGKSLCSILMTGMGSDGANGLLELRKRGAYTIAQDEKTSVVFGMPKAAIEIGAAHKVLALDKIGTEIFSQISMSAKRRGSA